MSNISMVSASVGGNSVGVTGSGSANVDDWTLDDIDISALSGTVSIVMDFDEAHFPGGGESDPYAIVSEGNISDVISSYTLTMDAVTGVVTLTFDVSDATAGSFTFDVSGHGDADDDVIINFVCFAEGTLISTATGLKPVQDLAVGDQVQTKSNGHKPVRWIGSKSLEQRDLADNSHLQPVVIKAGALGQGLPDSDLTVSPQHRICIDQNKTVQFLFGVDEALAPAKGLVDGKTIQISKQADVTYYHLMFDGHEIICSNGVWSESFYPGKQALSDLEKDARDELFELFPQLRSEGPGSYPAAAPLLTVQETRLLSKLDDLTSKESRLLKKVLNEKRRVS